MLLGGTSCRKLCRSRGRGTRAASFYPVRRSSWTSDNLGSDTCGTGALKREEIWGAAEQRSDSGTAPSPCGQALNPSEEENGEAPGTTGDLRRCFAASSTTGCPRPDLGTAVSAVGVPGPSGRLQKLALRVAWALVPCTSQRERRSADTWPVTTARSRAASLQARSRKGTRALPEGLTAAHGESCRSLGGARKVAL